MEDIAPITHDNLLRYYDLEKVIFTSSDYIVKDGDDIIFVTASVPVNITLPLAKGGRHVIITRIAGASSVTVTSPSGQTVNGVSTQVISTSYSPLRVKAVKGLGYLSI